MSVELFLATGGGLLRFVLGSVAIVIFILLGIGLFYLIWKLSQLTDALKERVSKEIPSKKVN